MTSIARADRPVRRAGRPIAQRARALRRGDLKHLILDLLRQRPRHGYDVMRALQDQVPGIYQPSPGAVYPVLRRLADLGLVVATAHDGRRVFAITPEGSRFLRDGEAALGEIRSRLDPPVEAELRSAMRAVNHELRALNRTLEPAVMRRLDAEQLRKVYNLVSRTRREIEAIDLTDRDGRPSQASAPRPRDAG